MLPDWIKEFPGAIMVCDAEGRILSMNDRSVEGFAKDGGAALLGTNIFDCHPEEARARIAALMGSKQPNVYTIEKKGLKKLIFQAPWFRDGVFSGLVELSLEIPAVLPHFNRDKT